MPRACGVGASYTWQGAKRGKIEPLARVNELVDRIQNLHGQPVEVVGLLTFEFEHTSIDHFPKAERREITDDIDAPFYQSSAWLAF